MPDPVSVSTFVEHALYDPDRGFYARGGRAGRRGDFLTAPEVGPLFGVLVGRALDGWWDGLGRPDPFVVHEHGAGPGTLARGVVQSSPRCAAALRWTLVERSAAQRDLHPAHLPHLGDELDASADAAWAGIGTGPLVASAEAAPATPPHVVLANELLDNLPFDLAERTPNGWDEVRLAGHDEVLVPLADDRARRLDRLAPSATTGARVALQEQAAGWLRDRLAQMRPGGRVVVLDYATTTAAMADRPWRDWVRTYRTQERGGEPFTDAGTQDVTVEVALDQLVDAVGPPTRDRTQAAALADWGIAALVEEARTSPAALAGPDALAALRIRSRLREADALLDPGGLGAFRVLEWTA